MTRALRCTVCDHRGPAPEKVQVVAQSGDQVTLRDVLARVKCTKCGTRGKAELLSPGAVNQRRERERLVGAGLDVVGDPVYHRSECRWVSRMNVNELVEFDSRMTAEFRGYRACKVCNP